MKSSINRIGLIDETVTHMRRCGHDLGAEDVTFVWKAAAGNVTPHELDAWLDQLEKRKSSGPSSEYSQAEEEAMMMSMMQSTSTLRALKDLFLESLRAKPLRL